MMYIVIVFEATYMCIKHMYAPVGRLDNTTLRIIGCAHAGY